MHILFVYALKQLVGYNCLCDYHYLFLSHLFQWTLYFTLQQVLIIKFIFIYGRHVRPSHVFWQHGNSCYSWVPLIKHSNSLESPITFLWNLNQNFHNIGIHRNCLKLILYFIASNIYKDEQHNRPFLGITTSTPTLNSIFLYIFLKWRSYFISSCVCLFTFFLIGLDYKSFSIFFFYLQMFFFLIGHTL